MNVSLTDLLGAIPQKLGEWRIPGMALGIVRGDELLCQQSFGLRDVENRVAPDGDTLFAIASTTKAMTATALGLLVDEGKVAWDEPVISYIPELRLNDEYATTRLCLRDMLSHNSGLPRHDQVWYGSGLTTAELLHSLRYLKPNKQMRTLYEYNNLMFTTAAVVIERVTGAPWDQFVRERLFTPLGMRHSNFSVRDTQKQDNIAYPYQKKDETTMERVPFREFDAMGGCGVVNSCASDMAKWISFNLSGGKVGGEALIKTETLAEIQSPQNVVRPNPVYYREMPVKTYGFGWSVLTYRGEKMITHSGGIDGFSSFVAALPDAGYGVVVLTNAGGASMHMALTYNIFDALLGQSQIDWEGRFKEQEQKGRDEADKRKAAIIATRDPSAPPSRPLADFAGKYAHPAYGEVTITLREGALTGSYHGQYFKLIHNNREFFEAYYTDDDYRPQLVRSRFTLKEDGSVEGFHLDLEPAFKGELIPFNRT